MLVWCRVVLQPSRHHSCCGAIAATPPSQECGLPLAQTRSDVMSCDSKPASAAVTPGDIAAGPGTSPDAPTEQREAHAGTAPAAGDQGHDAAAMAPEPLPRDPGPGPVPVSFDLSYRTAAEFVTRVQRITSGDAAAAISKLSVGDLLSASDGAPVSAVLELARCSPGLRALGVDAPACSEPQLTRLTSSLESAWLETLELASLPCMRPAMVGALLDRLPALSSLDCSQERVFKDINAGDFTPALERHRSLRTLCLPQIAFTTAGWTAVGRSVAIAGRITSLAVQYDGIPEGHLDRLPTFSGLLGELASCTSLTFLELCHTFKEYEDQIIDEDSWDWGDDDDDAPERYDGEIAFFRAVAAGTVPLAVARLSGCLSTGGWEALGGALASGTRMRALSLDDLPPDGATARCLADGLIASSLSELSLGVPTYQVTAAHDVLSAGVAQMTSLRSLGVTQGISYTGCSRPWCSLLQFARGLATPGPAGLQSLALAGDMSGPTFGQVASIVRNSSTLTRLSLHVGGLRDVTAADPGLAELRAAVMNSRSLEHSYLTVDGRPELVETSEVMARASHAAAARSLCWRRRYQLMAWRQGLCYDSSA